MILDDPVVGPVIGSFPPATVWTFATRIVTYNDRHHTTGYAVYLIIHDDTVAAAFKLSCHGLQARDD